MNDELQKPIETYSNTIVAFVVLQSLAFSYAFGTSEFFNCLMKTADGLTDFVFYEGVTILVLSVAANGLLGRVLWKRAGDNAGLIGWLYTGKTVALLMFGSMPPLLAGFYGGTGNGTCIALT